jgi:transcriptional regulator with XRE-family HTH domain
MYEKLRVWANEKLKTKPSMRDVAKKMGISHATVSRILSSTEPEDDFGFYIEFARAIDAIPELLKVSGLLPLPDVSEGIVSVYNNLTIDRQQEVIDFAEFLLQKQQKEDTENDRLA